MIAKGDKVALGMTRFKNRSSSTHKELPGELLSTEKSKPKKVKIFKEEYPPCLYPLFAVYMGKLSGNNT